jgi:glycosyltransferase involved in cell wall biosynthesis
MGRGRIDRARFREYLAGLDAAAPSPLPAGPYDTLSIVVPVYGHAAYLPETLRGITSQTRPPDEAVFVVDASPDDSAAILRAFIETAPATTSWRILVNERNLGQSASLNLGIGRAASALVMILNDDDYLMHDAVEVTLERFRANPGVALVGANHVSFSGAGIPAGTSTLSREYPGAALPLELHLPAQARRYRNSEELRMTHSGMAFVRAAWQAAGGYRAEIERRILPYSDRDFQIRVNALWPVAVATVNPIAFWRNDSSVDRLRNS